MPEQGERSPLVHIAGRAVRAPEIKSSSRGEFAVFNVGVTRYYDRERDDATRWVRVLVNKPQVIEFCQRHIRKGTPVVIEGGAYESEYQGQKQYNINAFRVGLVDWFILGQQQTQEEEEDL